MHDVLTFQVVRPLLEKKLAGDVKRKKVKEEVGQAGAIIDLTDMDDIASEAVDKMFDEGDSLLPYFLFFAVGIFACPIDLPIE